ncbi:MAG: type III-B CRISPR-associated protein Cas10/Cmr2 [Oscillospiraceae bacterium]|nr:type III-B CRISPR-associated protein Cas10/Cmr2 [Oscillospiraceae bacterium]
MSQYHAAITIGPIIETLCLTSSPVGLWCASGVFSWFSEHLCRKILAKWESAKIIVPYFEREQCGQPYSIQECGVGKYPDRILFSVDAKSAKDVKSELAKLVETAKNELAEKLEAESDAKVKMIQYIQVHFVVEEPSEKPEKNCILRLADYLDALEMNPTFAVDQTCNPIITLFEGESEKKHNQLLKDSFLMPKNSQIMRNEKIRKIEQIAAAPTGEHKKKMDYFAVVQADGDRMGKVLKTLIEDDDVKEFSQNCLKYTAEASDMIQKFGGVTIYAGGDDLLFLSPIENAEGKTLFELCEDIRIEFDAAFKSYGFKPTLSFGIAVNYVRYPLYEALEEARNMLEKAKKTKSDEEEKNKTAVLVRKHSGQSVQFRYPNGGVMYSSLTGLLKDNQNSVTMTSILHKLALYRPLLKQALLMKSDMQDVFDNLFDSGYHESVRSYINIVQKKLVEIYNQIKDGMEEDYALQKLHHDTPNTPEGTAVDMIYSMLRIVRFYAEERGNHPNE